MYKSEKFWDRMSKNYDSEENKTISETLEITKKHLKSSDIILDYACATGTYTINLSSVVKEAYGIDFSPKMIDAAKRKASENKIENINFIQSTIFDERFNKESFDVIIGFNILHLLQDLPAVIHRINTLLKPGGLFISVTPCLGQKKSFLSTSLAFLNKIKIVPKINFFKISDIEDLISHGHFQIVEMETLSDAIPNQCIVAKKI